MLFYIFSIFFQGLLASAATLDLLDGIRTKYDLPALAAGVITPDRTIQAQAAGYRKFGVPVNATAHDQYHLGSNTKAMTSVLIASYIEEGNFTWESTVEQVLPQWRERINEAYRNVTIAQLASHHSGITDAAAEEWIPKSGVTPEQVGDLVVAQFNMSAVDGRASYVEQAFNTTPISPSDEWSYSNQNYIILGFIVDILFGSFEEQLEERVWRPLNMTECGFGNFPEPNATAVEGIWPHELGNPDPVPKPPVWAVGSENPRLLGPAGTARCSPQSYAKFLALHLDGANGRDTPVLRAASFQRLHTPYLVNSGQNYTPGGWMVVDSPDPQVVNYLTHDGSNALNFATTMVFTRLDTAIFSFTNAGDSNPPNRAYDGVRETLQLFLNDNLNTLPIIENGTANSLGPGLQGIENDPLANGADRHDITAFHVIIALLTTFALL